MNSGILNDLDVHPRIISVAKKAGYNNSWKVLENSLGEVKTKTGLSALDTERLVKAAAQQCSPPYTTGWQMLQEDTPPNTVRHIKSGCCKLDSVLGGGIPCKGVTEIAGESGSGKTQMALQVTLQCQLPVDSGGLGKGVAYICTETQFPVSRLNQLISFRRGQRTYNGKHFSDNIYVHHLPDMDNLVDCVRYQLPQFVSQKGIGLVIIDSVAAVFRAAEEKQEVKSKMVQQLGFRLRQLADNQNVAILAINQVTAAIGGNTQGMIEDNVVPALGLSWANLITTRVMLRNTSFSILSERETSFCTTTRNNTRESSPEDNKELKTELSGELFQPETRVRTLDVIFSPWLARKSSPFIVTEKGIKDADQFSLTLSRTG